ncbi:MAG: ribosomal protein S18-alanine N-acetyltransferase [Ilumatobacter sp.]|uniref:ribosomal protein S18-alanine N-acetyltransferase n=1 Tax=Ilumatobacter sp. TaxID=1967498 RepID=UPI003C773D72
MSVIERMLGRADGSGDDGLVIAPMRKRDLKHGILETESHAYPKPWSPSVFQSEIDQVKTGSRLYLTARRVAKGPVVGHAGLWFTHDEAHVTNVAVHPDARRSGVATALMLALADEAIRRDCVAWTLEVRVSSEGAQELYRNFGFVPAGVRKNYYENVEDAIVMWCHDIQDAEYAERLERLGATR